MVLIVAPKGMLQPKVFTLVYEMVKLLLNLSPIVVIVFIISRSSGRKREDSNEGERCEERLSDFGLHNNSFPTVSPA